MSLCNITYLTFLNLLHAWICFKFYLDVSWVGPYQDCKNRGAIFIGTGIVANFVLCFNKFLKDPFL